MQGAATLERAGHPAREQAVAVGAAERVAAGVEAVRCGDRLEHGNVIVQDPVQAPRQIAGDLRRREARHLSPGVDPGVRASGDAEGDRVAKDRLQGRRKLALDGAHAGLGRPAAEAGAVVLQGQSRRGHGRRG